MSDAPKRRGRPPKVRPEPMTLAEAFSEVAQEQHDAANHAQAEAEATAVEDRPTEAWFGTGVQNPTRWADDPWSALRQMGDPYPLGRYRFKAGVLQQAWQHPTGVQWRPVPVVPADTSDWEDG